MDTSLFYVAGILALAPTLILMYVLLRKYTYPYVERPYFSDPTFFILFAVGLIAGVVMFLVYSYLIGNIIATVVYAIIQVMVPLMVMNLKRYRGKTDSVFYGLGFGLGAGGSTAVGFIYYLSSSADRLGDSMDAAGWVFLFVVGLSMIMQYTAVGTTVGEAIARHELTQFGVQAMVYNVVYWIVFTIMLMNSSTVFMYLMAVAVLAVSVFYLWFSKICNASVERTNLVVLILITEIADSRTAP